MMILSATSLCSSLLVLGCGGIVGSIGDFLGGIMTPKNVENALGSIGFTMQGTPDIPNPGGLVSIAGLLLGFLGILGLVLAIALLAVAIGLFATKTWAYWGAIILNAAYIALQLTSGVLSWAAGLSGGVNIIQIVFIALSATAILVLLLDRTAREAFRRA
jgi:hypothetical protein